MKDFCNIIKIYLLQDILSFRENVITLKLGCSAYILSTDDFILTPREETSEAGTIYNIEEDIPIEKVIPSVATTYRVRRSAILQFETLPEHEPVFIGSLQWPTLVSITTHLNKDILSFHSKMKQSPL